MNVLVPKEVHRTRDLDGGQQQERSLPVGADGRGHLPSWCEVCCWWHSSTSPVSTAGGMNSTVAPRPIASSARVASTGPGRTRGCRW
jgi:hypothetical protein